MLTTLLAAAAIVAAPIQPLRLHPKNPHYLEFRGKPTVLITSGEHYGAVLNLDFDTIRYLDTLKKDGLNLTRLFSGVYCESSSDFNIRGNTLAPAPNRYISPFGRSSTPGYPNGGNKFDLTKWDEAYFQRLTDFCRQAGKRGIVVEVVLFCPFYEESMWNLSPMNAKNNVNGVGNVPRGEVYTLKHEGLTRLQDAVVAKIVDALKEFDNVYYEVCNEPYFGGVTLEWQKHIGEQIARAEESHPHKHLIAQNVANGSAKITDPVLSASIFNFHYASPPNAVVENYGLDKPVAFDETGFKGSDDFTYRAQAWEFLLAGGAIFSNLDYSFTVARPDGTAPVAPPTPGGGSPTLRRQLGILKSFMSRFDFFKMAPDLALLAGPAPAGLTVHALSESSRQYALYVRGSGPAELSLKLPPGKYLVNWVDPRGGAVTGGSSRIESGTTGEASRLTLPVFTEDVAARITRVP